MTNSQLIPFIFAFFFVAILHIVESHTMDSIYLFQRIIRTNAETCSNFYFLQYLLNVLGIKIKWIFTIVISCNFFA